MAFLAYRSGGKQRDLYLKTKKKSLLRTASHRLIANQSGNECPAIAHFTLSSFILVVRVQIGEMRPSWITA